MWTVAREIVYEWGYGLHRAVRGRYCRFEMAVSSAPRVAGVEFEMCPGPREFLDALKAGFEDYLCEMEKKGRPARSLRIVVRWIRYHDVDSSERGFRLDAFLALSEVFREHGVRAE